MTQYYVATIGSDSNPGTVGSPFLTIGHAAGVVVAGDTVNVAPGAYPETLTISANGTALSPITFLSTVRWGALITNPAAAFASVNIQGAYTIFDGFEVINPTNQFGVDFEAGSDGSVVRRCLIHNVGTSVVTTGGGIGCVLSGITVPVVADRNVIHDIGFAGNGNNQHGFYMSTNFSGGSGTAKIINNLIYNLLSGSGVQLWGDPQGWDVLNNTIFNCPNYEGVVMGATTGHTLANNHILNNIFYGCAIPAHTVAGGGTYGTGNLVEYNLDYLCAGGYSLDGSVTVANNLLATDPKLANYQADGSGNYRLTGASPCRGAGTSVGAPATDYDGNARPYLGGYDIGAYQFYAKWKGF